MATASMNARRVESPQRRKHYFLKAADKSPSLLYSRSFQEVDSFAGTRSMPHSPRMQHYRSAENSPAALRSCSQGRRLASEAAVRSSSSVKANRAKGETEKNSRDTSESSAEKASSLSSGFDSPSGLRLGRSLSSLPAERSLVYASKGRRFSEDLQRSFAGVVPEEEPLSAFDLSGESMREEEYLLDNADPFDLVPLAPDLPYPSHSIERNEEDCTIVVTSDSNREGLNECSQRSCVSSAQQDEFPSNNSSLFCERQAKLVHTERLHSGCTGDLIRSNKALLKDKNPGLDVWPCSNGNELPETGSTSHSCESPNVHGNQPDMLSHEASGHSETSISEKHSESMKAEHGNGFLSLLSPDPASLDIPLSLNSYRSHSNFKKAEHNNGYPASINSSLRLNWFPAHNLEQRSNHALIPSCKSLRAEYYLPLHEEHTSMCRSIAPTDLLPSSLEEDEDEEIHAARKYGLHESFCSSRAAPHQAGEKRSSAKYARSKVAEVSPLSRSAKSLNGIRDNSPSSRNKIRDSSPRKLTPSPSRCPISLLKSDPTVSSKPPTSLGKIQIEGERGNIAQSLIHEVDSPSWTNKRCSQRGSGFNRSPCSNYTANNQSLTRSSDSVVASTTKPASLRMSPRTKAASAEKVGVHARRHSLGRLPDETEFHQPNIPHRFSICEGSSSKMPANGERLLTNYDQLKSLVPPPSCSSDTDHRTYDSYSASIRENNTGFDDSNILHRYDICDSSSSTVPAHGQRLPKNYDQGNELKSMVGPPPFWSSYDSAELYLAAVKGDSEQCNKSSSKFDPPVSPKAHSSFLSSLKKPSTTLQSSGYASMKDDYGMHAINRNEGLDEVFAQQMQELDTLQLLLDEGWSPHQGQFPPSNGHEASVNHKDTGGFHDALKEFGRAIEQLTVNKLKEEEEADFSSIESQEKLPAFVKEEEQIENSPDEFRKNLADQNQNGSSLLESRLRHVSVSSSDEDRVWLVDDLQPIQPIKSIGIGFTKCDFPNSEQRSESPTEGSQSLLYSGECTRDPTGSSNHANVFCMDKLALNNKHDVLDVQDPLSGSITDVFLSHPGTCLGMENECNINSSRLKTVDGSVPWHKDEQVRSDGKLNESTEIEINALQDHLFNSKDCDKMKEESFTCALSIYKNPLWMEEFIPNKGEDKQMQAIDDDIGSTGHQSPVSRSHGTTRNSSLMLQQDSRCHAEKHAEMFLHNQFLGIDDANQSFGCRTAEDYAKLPNGQNKCYSQSYVQDEASEYAAGRDESFNKCISTDEYISQSDSKIIKEMKDVEQVVLMHSCTRQQDREVPSVDSETSSMSKQPFYLSSHPAQILEENNRTQAPQEDSLKYDGSNRRKTSMEGLDVPTIESRQENKWLQNFLKENEGTVAWFAKEKAIWERLQVCDTDIMASFEKEQAAELETERPLLEKQLQKLLCNPSKNDEIDLEGVTEKILQVTDEHFKKAFCWRLTTIRLQQLTTILIGQIQGLEEKVKLQEREVQRVEGEAEERNCRLCSKLVREERGASKKENLQAKGKQRSEKRAAASLLCGGGNMRDESSSSSSSMGAKADKRGVTLLCGSSVNTRESQCASKKKITTKEGGVFISMLKPKQKQKQASVKKR